MAAMAPERDPTVAVIPKTLALYRYPSKAALRFDIASASLSTIARFEFNSDAIVADDSVISSANSSSFLIIRYLYL
jgi:hypothetical protein